MLLDALLERDEGAIVDESTASVVQTHMPHYDAAGEASVRKKLDRLYARMREAVRTRNSTHLEVYARRIARERFEAGFDLSEVQAAIHALEEAVWRRVLEAVEARDYAECLGLVSTALGLAKDALAQEYVTLASRSHAPSLDLRALFEGTTEDAAGLIEA